MNRESTAFDINYAMNMLKSTIKKDTSNKNSTRENGNGLDNGRNMSNNLSNNLSKKNSGLNRDKAKEVEPRLFEQMSVLKLKLFSMLSDFTDENPSIGEIGAEEILNYMQQKGVQEFAFAVDYTDLEPYLTELENDNKIFITGDKTILVL